MNAEAFWRVIGNFNQETWIIQCIIFMAIIAGVTLAYFGRLVWLPKIILGAVNFFIAIVFFVCYGTEPVQIYFAVPLYLAVGILFLLEGVKHSDSLFIPFNRVQWFLLILVMLYPGISLILGHSFPQMVTYIMPCPVVSMSIVIYSCYEHKNKLVLMLLAIWGLTGIKSYLFNVLEDSILLICGIYCIVLLVKEILPYFRANKNSRNLRFSENKTTDNLDSKN